MGNCTETAGQSARVRKLNMWKSPLFPPPPICQRPQVKHFPLPVVQSISARRPTQTCHSLTTQHKSAGRVSFNSHFPLLFDLIWFSCFTIPGSKRGRSFSLTSLWYTSRSPVLLPVAWYFPLRFDVITLLLFATPTPLHYFQATGDSVSNSGTSRSLNTCCFWLPIFFFSLRFEMPSIFPLAIPISLPNFQTGMLFSLTSLWQLSLS